MFFKIIIDIIIIINTTIIIIMVTRWYRDSLMLDSDNNYLREQRGSLHTFIIRCIRYCIYCLINIFRKVKQENFGQYTCRYFQSPIFVFLKICISQCFSRFVHFVLIAGRQTHLENNLPMFSSLVRLLLKFNNFPFSIAHSVYT